MDVFTVKLSADEMVLLLTAIERAAELASGPNAPLYRALWERLTDVFEDRSR